MIPITGTGRLFLLLLTLLAAGRVLGLHGVRIGPAVPEIHLWWLGILATVALFFVTPSRKQLRPYRMALVCLLLSVALWPLSVWRRQIVSLSPPTTAKIYRLSQESPSPEQSTRIDSLQIENRKYLNRIVRRRRDIAMEIAGFLRVARSGNHRFQFACDDRCAIQIDGEVILARAPSGQKEVFLDSGMHRFVLRFEQDSGPAYLKAGWDTPEFLELLSLDDYLADSVERLSPDYHRRKQLEVSLSLLLAVAWWFFAFGLLLRGAERLRWFYRDSSGTEPALARHAVLFVSIACALSVPVLDMLLLDVPERRLGPSFSHHELLRSLLLVVSASLFIWLMHIYSRHRDTSGGGALNQVLESRAFQWLRWPLLLLAVSFPLLHGWDPELFSRLGREDGPIENASALLLLMASFLTFASAWFIRRTRTGAGPQALCALSLALVFFVIGMEEISWGQRILGFESPEPFLESDQPETNLHNIATDLFEQWYYSLAMVFLIVIPFVHERTAILTRIPFVGLFVPVLAVAFLTAPVAAFNYDTWNSPSNQWFFYVTFFILVYYFVLVVREGRAALDRVYFLLLPLALVAIQAEFLLVGGFVRYWDVTEYKELFFPLGFFIYSVTLLFKVKRPVSNSAA